MFLRALARPLLASWFIYGGVESLLDPTARADRSRPLLDPILEETGVTVPTPLLVQIHGGLTIAAATALAFSKTPRTAATALAGLAAVTAAAGRPFWRIEDPMERAHEREEFVKNLSLLGGVLIAATAGNSRRKKKKARGRRRR